MEEKETKNLVVSRVDIKATLLHIPVGGQVSLKMEDVTKESARVACHRMKKSHNRAFRVLSLGKTEFAIVRIK